MTVVPVDFSIDVFKTTVRDPNMADGTTLVTAAPDSTLPLEALTGETRTNLMFPSFETLTSLTGTIFAPGGTLIADRTCRGPPPFVAAAATVDKAERPPPPPPLAMTGAEATLMDDGMVRQLVLSSADVKAGISGVELELLSVSSGGVGIVLSGNPCCEGNTDRDDMIRLPLLPTSSPPTPLSL